MIRLFHYAILGTIVALLSGCGGSDDSDSPKTVQVPKGEIQGNGIVEYKSIEGGFYSITGAGGEHYDPIDLPREYMVNGLHVFFVADTVPGAGSAHMYGTTITVKYIGVSVNN